LPALESLAGVLEGLLAGFNALPGPVQTLLASFAALAAAAVVFAPIVSAVTTLGPLLSGLLPVLGGIVSALTGGGGVMAAIAAVFSGPVGWIALAVAAGVAIYTFRDQIAAVFQFIGNVIMKAWELYKSIYIDPIVNAAKMIYDAISQNWKKIFDFVSGIVTKVWNFYNDTFIQPLINAGKNLLKTFKSIFTSIGNAIKAPIEAAFNFIKGIVNNILQGISNAINGVVDAINRVIQAANAATSKVGLPSIPQIPRVSVPQFAQGGVVNGPTIAMVGEGGEPEYIVPQSKASGFAKNWMAGRRGIGAIPGFAEGGVVNAGSNTGTGNTTIQITTGPVLQQDSQNYVSVKDLESALKQMSTQIYRNQQSLGWRRFSGVA